MFRASARAGDSSMGLNGTNGNLFNVLLATTWAENKDGMLIELQERRMFTRFEAEAERLGVTNPYVYLNYTASWQDPISGYGANKKAFLRRVSNEGSSSINTGYG
ncbi:oxidoreductase- FAD-binding [Apiospora kogelbergensis]|uniref:oxidoreductase- FAD-binding n=1 Tax=Apiospora kogelbergensis TaxID=1337665 RepID=UPI0031324B35